MRIFTLIIAVMLFFLTMGCKQRHDLGKDEQTIQNIILQMTEGFNKHDAKAATQMYASNADFVNVRGDKYTGAAEIQQKLAAILSTRAKEATLKTLNTTIRFVNPELAIAHVTNELSGLVDTAGLKLPSHQELSIRVFIKEKGNWRVTAFHNTMIRPFWHISSALVRVRNKIRGTDAGITASENELTFCTTTIKSRTLC